MNKAAFPGHYSILMVEDNPLDAELTADRLRGGGLSFDIRVVDTRAAFESALADGTYDIVLADYSLPDFDGRKALQAVRAVDSRIPFVFVSGVLGEDVAVDTLLAGATDYVLKQRPERLVPAVLRALSEYAEFKSRERAELEKKKTEEQFAQLTNRIPAMVWTCDLEGRLTFTNSLWQDSVGDALTVFDPSLVHAGDLAAFNAVWAEAQRTGEAFELDCRYRMRNGEYRWQLVWAAPVEDDHHHLSGWVGTLTDTEQQRSRDVQSRTAEKLALTGRMASVIAHEINNPLEAMTNLLYLLRSELMSDPGREYLAQIEHEMVRISAITKLTLQWSREENAGAMLSASALVEESFRVFASKLNNKSIRVEIDVPDDLSFYGLAGEMRQVLANLITNAIDAVSIGGHILCRARAVSSGGRPCVELTVQDNGTGIEPSRMQDLFMPFHTTKGSLGNGLGLYISKSIVDRHRGELLVESVFGQGTSVRVVLPVQAASPSEPSVPPDRA